MGSLLQEVFVNNERSITMTTKKYYELSLMFRDDLMKVLDFMERNDPNGEYDLTEMILHPMEHIESLERWKEDMGCESTEKERILFDDLISTLYVVYFAVEAAEGRAPLF